MAVFFVFSAAQRRSRIAFRGHMRVSIRTLLLCLMSPALYKTHQKDLLCIAYPLVIKHGWLEHHRFLNCVRFLARKTGYRFLWSMESSKPCWMTPEGIQGPGLQIQGLPSAHHIAARGAARRAHETSTHAAHAARALKMSI